MDIIYCLSDGLNPLCQTLSNLKQTANLTVLHVVSSQKSTIFCHEYMVLSTALP